MKKALKIILGSLLVYIIIFTAVLITVKISAPLYKNIAKYEYSNLIGGTLYPQKLFGMELQNKALDLGDNYFILGSSELSGSSSDPFHPVNVFKGKSAGFQINMVGRGNTQSLVHSLNILSRNERFKNKKITYIVSPQWFTPGGLKKERFLENFSPLQLYYLLADDSIPPELKNGVLKRIQHMIGSDSRYNLQSRLIHENLSNKKDSILIKPLAQVDYDYLKLKDQKDASDIEKIYHDRKTPKENKNINWAELLSKANSLGDESSSNEFFVNDKYFNLHLKDRMSKFKDSQKHLTLTDSIEYEDFEMLLKIFKHYNMDVLIVNTPVNGRWYDYTGLSKEERQGVYSRVSALIEKYDFKELDLSSKEYDPFILKDIMHLGWKGWVNIDEAIYKHYNETF